MHRFFIEGRRSAGEWVDFDPSDAHKIVHVLRLRTGSCVEVIDSTSTQYEAVLECSDRGVRANLGQAREPQESTLAWIAVAQAVPKGQKMDFVVEKLTELGAAAILPLYTERSVVTETGSAKRERWQRLAKSAAQQCGRAQVPQIGPPIRFSELCGTFSEYDLVLMPWELAAGEPAVKELPAMLAGKRRILLLVGPEGGFSHGEAASAVASGAHTISLGKRILRTETAAMVAVALIGFLTEGLGITQADGKTSD